MLAVVMLLAGCETTPRTRALVRHTYLIKAVGEAQRQTRGNITVEDMGEAKRVVQPVRVQACDGARLLFKQREVTRYRNNRRYKDIESVPVFETVHPLRGIYVRWVKITNNSEHNLVFSRLDPVLVDGAGNDLDGLGAGVLVQNVLAGRPCPSTHALVQTLRGLKLLGKNTRVRRGREDTFLVAFSGVDKSITGDWVLELNDFPVATNAAGQVTRITSFRFPLESRGYRTTIRQRKEGMFTPWVEIGRHTEEIR